MDFPASIAPLLLLLRRAQFAPNVISDPDMLEQQCNDLFSGTVETQMWKEAHMIFFRLTPLWKIKETEQWLNDLAANGQVLRAVYGPFYYFSPFRDLKEQKNPPAFWFEFYEQGLSDHGMFLWDATYHGLSIPCHFNYYMIDKYRNSKTRARGLEEEWYIRRDLYAKGASENHIAMSLLCMVVFPFVCYDQGLKIGFWLSIVGFFLWLVKSIYGLTVISRRLKRYRASQIQEKR